MRITILNVLFMVVLVLPGTQGWAGEQDQADLQGEKIRQLEQTVEALTAEVQALKTERSTNQATSGNASYQRLLDQMRRDIDEIKSSKALDLSSWLNKFTLGGYGEFHANFGEGAEKDVFDIHRMVVYVGYEFADWIRFNSETEIEHAYVSDDSGGELSLEQAYVDFLLSAPVNVRVGRVLTPLGIINKKHEPPYFNGVERPSFSKYIIPTTWASDGAGVFGSMGPLFQYEAYIVGGLDGSEFDDKNGIRSGRIKERPSLQEPAVTGRVDVYPLTNSNSELDQELRLGLSGYWGGLNNGNNGSNPSLNGDIQIYSADFEYSVSCFDFRGVIADTRISDAREIGSMIGENLAKEIFGFYVESAYHFMPDAWKQGRLENADAVVFVRYDDFDTQHKMPSGMSGIGAYDRNEWTLGVSFYPAPKLVLKMDYQIRDDDSGHSVPDLLNFGLGWVF